MEPVALPSADPGFGFVAADIPELSRWVASSNRGQGLGRRLLRAVQQEARLRRLRHISLSVEEINHARRLYEQEGFVGVPDRRAEGVMLWTAG
jgi:ribosomal protein S18 acetylase RimI-like enzyme